MATGIADYTNSPSAPADDPYRTPVSNPIAAGIGRGVPGQRVIGTAGTGQIGRRPAASYLQQAPVAAPVIGSGEGQFNAPVIDQNYTTPAAPRATRTRNNATSSILSNAAAPVAPGRASNQSSPMTGGSRPIDRAATGGANIDAGNRMIAQAAQGNPAYGGPPSLPGSPGGFNPIQPLPINTAPMPFQAAQRLNAKNGISDQVSRQMYKVAMDANPGNPAAGEQQFHETMAKYGVSGHALLDKWGGAPQTQVVTPGAVTVNRTPYDLLGTDKSGGTQPPGMPGGSVYNATVAAPTVGPIPGYTELPANTGIAATNKLQPSDQNLGRIRDINQAPYTAEQEIQNRANEGANLVRAGEQKLNNAPLTPREIYQGQQNLAQAAVQAPLVNSEIKAGGQVGAAEARATGAEKVAETNGQTKTTTTDSTNTSKENIAAGNNKSKETIDANNNTTRVTTAKMRKDALTETQQLKNLGAYDASKVRGAIGGKPGDPVTAQQKVFISAFAKTAAMDENLNPRKVEDRIAEAQKIVQAGAGGAAPSTQPATQPAAQPDAATHPVTNQPIPQGATPNPDGSITRSGKRYVRDQVNQGWRKAG